MDKLSKTLPAKTAIMMRKNSSYIHYGTKKLRTTKDFLKSNKNIK